MDLEEQDEDRDEGIPAGRPAGEERPQRRSEPAPSVSEGRSSGNGHTQSEVIEGGTKDASAEGSSGPEGGREPRGFRGRRRRRGRSGEPRDRGERGSERGDRAGERVERDASAPRPRSNLTEVRTARPAAPEARTGRDYDYGPPAGYQPMILPVES